MNPGGSLRVLVVEDDRVDRAAIRRALRNRKASSPRAGVELEEAVDIAAALRLHAEHDFDCALVDYGLPDGTALELIRALHDSPKGGVPVVVLTGHRNEDFALAALQHGAQDYLTKDELDTRTLMRAIRYAIERARVGEMQKHLVRADRLISIGQLATGIAHEVNNPASYVVSSLEIIEVHLARVKASVEASTFDASVGAQLDECAELVGAGLEGMQRIRSIISSLSHFARLDHDEVQAVALAEVVDSACSVLHSELGPRARLVVDLAPLPIIAADRGRLIQVCTNLLENAIEAIEPGAAEHNEIHISGRVEAGAIHLRIKDTGAGIEPATLERVFRPFFTTKARATGLGLSLCQDIVRKHGGELRIDSQPGQGTCVDVILPLSRAPSPA